MFAVGGVLNLLRHRQAIRTDAAAADRVRRAARQPPGLPAQSSRRDALSAQRVRHPDRAPPALHLHRDRRHDGFSTAAVAADLRRPGSGRSARHLRDAHPRHPAWISVERGRVDCGHRRDRRSDEHLRLVPARTRVAARHRGDRLLVHEPGPDHSAAAHAALHDTSRTPDSYGVCAPSRAACRGHRLPHHRDRRGGRRRARVGPARRDPDVREPPERVWRRPTAVECRLERAREHLDPVSRAHHRQPHAGSHVPSRLRRCSSSSSVSLRLCSIRWPGCSSARSSRS